MSTFDPTMRQPVVEVDASGEPVSPATAALVGALTETAPTTDTASSGLNGRLQRIAQRLTTMLTGLSLAAGTASIGATKDDGPNWTTVWGVAAAPFASADASVAASVTDAPTSGQKLVIDDLVFSSGAAITLTFKCETSGAVIAGPFYMAANSSMALNFRGKGPKLATADKKLQVQASGAGAVMVLVGYHSEA
jgi:hypothetical protein